MDDIQGKTNNKLRVIRQILIIITPAPHIEQDIFQQDIGMFYLKISITRNCGHNGSILLIYYMVIFYINYIGCIHMGRR